MRELSQKQKELIREYYRNNRGVDYFYFTNYEYLAYRELIDKLEELNNYETVSCKTVDRLLWDLSKNNNLKLETWG